MIYAADASDCDGFLHVESWDLRRLHGPVASKADQMLMVSYDVDPWARYTPENVWEWNSPDTKKDINGYKLLRPYHHVSVDLRTCATRCAAECVGSKDGDTCLATCASTCEEPDKAAPYKVAIYNVEIWMENTLNYEVLATCVAPDPPCPRPTQGDMCSGASNGVCVRTTHANGDNVTDAVMGTCKCVAGFGDVGCDKTLVPLANAVAADGDIPMGEWMYYDFEVPRPEVGGYSFTIVPLHIIPSSYPLLIRVHSSLLNFSSLVTPRAV